MHLIKSLPALFVAAASLWAADPFVGTWRLNVEQSDFGSGPKANSGSATYVANGDGYMYTSETLFGEDRVARLQGLVQFDGKVNEGTFNGRAVTFLSNRIDANNYEMVLSDKETGKVSHTFRYSISSDGNTLTFTSSNVGDEKPRVKFIYDKS
jgi:hypothetical protein